MNPSITVIIPAYNEEQSIGLVVSGIPNIVKEIIVVNNGSTDATADCAFKAGAIVLDEPRKGYGYACLKGIKFIEHNPPDIVVFLDGDYSDYPEQLTAIITPIITEKVDFVVGARVKPLREKKSMTVPQVFGNALATFLMRLFFGSTFTDLGPFRAIRFSTLKSLEMEDKTYGWTIEMQLKVITRKISYCEVPVKYRNRIGQSKVSGTLKGVILAGVKILFWIFKFSLK